jgi:hypothetical protein
MAKWDILKYLRTSNSHVVWLTRQRIKDTAEGTIHFFRSLLETRKPISSIGSHQKPSHSGLDADSGGVIRVGGWRAVVAGI